MDSRVRRVYELAARAARDQAFTYYQQVADELKLDMSNPAHRNELAHLSGRVSEAEHEAGRPMLSAVVVLAGDSPIPGEGFFTLARALGKFAGTTDDEKMAFHLQELARVYEAWRRP
jgi:hypothetical protein